MSARNRKSSAADGLKDCIRDLDAVSARIARIIDERSQPQPAPADSGPPLPAASDRRSG